MKKVTFLASALLFSSVASAQIFSDDFESYSVGQYVGPAATEWTTWSGTEGGAEDAQVTSAQANSGSNSIYFSSSDPNGGPQDVILDFGQAYTSGIFTFESAFYVDAGNNAYFNFQGTSVPGTTWSFNCNMENGEVILDDGITANLAVGSYTPDTWFTLRVEADLDLGRWTASIDGTCIGVWQNGVNAIASLDLYPIENSSFYVDDIWFDYQTNSYGLNAAVVGVSDQGRFIAGEDVYPLVTVGNAGSTTINSFDVTIDYNGSQYVENVTGQSLTTNNTMDVQFTTAIQLVDGQEPIVATVSNVNGFGADENVSDDGTCGTKTIAVTPAPGKIVVSEEGTGTWCPWCVRGTVFMSQFESDYGSDYWAGIAVHNDDPMVVTEYDMGLGGLITGYPSALVDRGNDVDPSDMLNDFLDRLVTAPDALMTNGATWDAGTRELQVSISADFQTAGTDGYKMICVLTEDGVTGTDADYAQANAYAGGNNGEMGGYELLPSPVPASQMVYDHVARAIAPSFIGNNDCFPASFNSGEIITQNFTFVLPAEWDETKVHIVGMLIDPSGRINNADKTYISEAETNGFVNACNLSTGSIYLNQVDDVLNIYPNPTSLSTTVAITLNEKSSVQLAVVDMAGKQIAFTDYGMISSSTVTMNTASLNAGVYMVELIVNGQKTTKRLVIE